MIFGDLAFYAGIVGIILYICVMVIKNTTQSAKLADAVRKYDDRIAAHQAKLKEFQDSRSESAPQVDALVSKVLELRQLRDSLQMELEELEQRIREREIHIGSRSH